MRQPAPHQLAEQLLARSEADHTQAIVSCTARANTRWARNGLTTNGNTFTTEVTLIAIQDGRDGSSVAALTRPAAGLELPGFAAEALQQAKTAAPAWDAQPLPQGVGGPAGDWYREPVPVTAADLAGTLGCLGGEIAADEAAGREHFGYLERSATSTWLATSEGIRLRHDQPAARLEMTVKSHQRSRSTWQGYSGPDFAAADPAAMAAQARTELAWQAHRVEVAPGRRTAILSPAAVADLMIDLLWGADARAAAEGRSVFSAPAGQTLIGQALTPRELRLYSDPAMPGQGAAPFLLTTMSHDTASVFDNGLPITATDWIADGRLAALVCSRATAARTGVPLALAPDNLALQAGGSGALSDVVARTAQGLLVTCTWYNRMVDPRTHLITGLTRDGVYVVRDGEVIGQAGNFRFNDSPVEILGRIIDAGATGPALGREMADYFPRTAMPGLVVSDFNLSSASEAV